MNKTMRLGILQTDQVRAEFRDEFGDYPDMFTQLLQTAALQLGIALSVRNYWIQGGEQPPELGECDAYLITGSRDSVYDELPWIEELSDLIRRLHAQRRPMVGICFGHQLIAQCLGGKTEAASGGWAVGVHTSRVVDPQAWMQPPFGSIQFAI